MRATRQGLPYLSGLMEKTEKMGNNIFKSHECDVCASAMLRYKTARESLGKDIDYGIFRSRANIKTRLQKYEFYN